MVNQLLKEVVQRGGGYLRLVGVFNSFLNTACTYIHTYVRITVQCVCWNILLFKLSKYVHSLGIQSFSINFFRCTYFITMITFVLDVCTYECTIFYVTSYVCTIVGYLFIK